MNRKNLLLVIPPLAVLASLVACGGGGDPYAGSPTALSVVPATLTLKPGVGAPTGSCYVGFAGEVFIYGGVAPYRLDNTAPDAVQLDRTEVSDRGGSFKVNFTNGICLTTMIVVIVDKLDHQIQLKLTNSPAS